MGVNVSIERVSACDIKYIQQEIPHNYLIISTIPNDRDAPLISGTVNSSIEEYKINHYMKNEKSSTNTIKGIIVYGKNSSDASVIEKYKQLLQFGITNVYVYFGGLFEWLLLHKQYPNVFLLDNTTRKYNVWEFCGEPNRAIVKKT